MRPCEPTDKPAFSTELDVVYQTNDICPPPKPRRHHHYIPDPVNVYNINGDQVGYSWNYGDLVKLIFNLNTSVLCSDPEHIELFEIYLCNKLVEFTFSDIRGNEIYKYYVPAKLFTDLILNNSEETLIERNTYKLSVVLVDPNTGSRLSLYLQPYDVYVR